MIKDKEVWADIRSPFMGGWNNFLEAGEIADNESPEVQNAVYDGGFIAPRSGSSLVFEKPEDEDLDPLQVMVAKTSDGVDYFIPIYGNHFYLWHEENEELIRINNTYVPDELDLPYGWVNWNNGRSDDRLYFCNGVDNFGRWDICVSTADGDHTAGASTFTIDDASRFPSTGTLVISGDTSVFTEAYTSKAGNVFTLTNTLNQNVGNGASVTMDIAEKAGMELGKVVSKYQGRLMVMNYYGGETTVWGSVQTDPEDYTVGSDIEDAFTEVISDGNGEIKGAHDFGAFLVIEKEDSIHRFEIIIADDLGSKLTKITPIVSGQSLGPLGQHSTVKILNRLLYPTRTEGFISLYPAGTGNDTSVDTKIISDKIQTYATKSVDYVSCKGVGFDQKALFAVSLDGGTQNIIVLVYDTIRQIWSRITGWAVKDWAYKGSLLYYLDNGTGALRQVFNGSYHDDNNPYMFEVFSKRFDFGKMSQPKTEDLIYVQGYMTPASDLYIDVLMNEGGDLSTQTFRLNKDTPNIYYSQPLTSAIGEFIAGQPAMGYVILSEIGDVSFFRCYLGIDISKGFYNLQLRTYQNKQAFVGITGIGFNPELAEAIPAPFVVSPI